MFQSRCQDSWGCDFSGTIYTEDATSRFQSRCQDSWGCDEFYRNITADDLIEFQSRCQDSWGCDVHLKAEITPSMTFQSRCQDSWGCDKLALVALCSPLMFQSRCQDSWGCDIPTSAYPRAEGYVSVPLPGFMGLRRCLCEPLGRATNCFSPVARIHGVATHCH